MEEAAEAIAESRNQSLQKLALQEPYFDAGLIGGREVVDATEEDVFRLDYLAPYLPNPRSKKLTKQQAFQARDECLKASPGLQNSQLQQP